MVESMLVTKGQGHNLSRSPAHLPSDLGLNLAALYPPLAISLRPQGTRTLIIRQPLPGIPVDKQLLLIPAPC